jgi:uncharacterized protein (DUF1330 family)
MIVTNKLHPAPQQAMAFFGADDGQPICMVNLLKFKDKAAYADGSEPDLSGAEAYARYAAGVAGCIAAVGGKLRFGGAVTGLLIGEIEEPWDMVAIAEYPSRKAMMAMVQSPEYQAISKHREAGLAGQINICTRDRNA